MKILDWLRGDDGEQDETPPDDDGSEEDELPGDEDDPTTYPLW
jgi:hypothetical protein